MFPSAFHDIDPGRIDAQMSQKIRQLGDIPLQTVKYARKETPEIVRKDFVRFHTGAAAQAFHLGPDIGTVHRISVFRDKDRPARDSFLPAVAHELPAQFSRQQHSPLLSLAVDLRPARAQRFRRDETKLGDADSGGGDGLQNKR